MWHHRISTFLNNLPSYPRVPEHISFYSFITEQVSGRGQRDNQMLLLAIQRFLLQIFTSLRQMVFVSRSPVPDPFCTLSSKVVGKMQRPLGLRPFLLQEPRES